MKVTILGCGEAFDERLPNTSMLVEMDAAKLLLDCGYSAPPHVWKHVRGADEIDAVYITHGHADHYFGLPALLGRMWEDGRTKPLTLFSQQYVLDATREALELGYRGLPARYRFPLQYCAIEPGRTVEFGGAALDFAPTKHAAPNVAIRVTAGGRVFCYSGDGMVTDASRELMAGAALVVHEAYLFEPTPVHADFPALVELQAGHGIGRLAFVHVQRALRAAPQRILELVHQSNGSLLLPEPGAAFELKADSGRLTADG